MDFKFTSFENLAINWINAGRDPNNPYPTGGAIDVSHGEERCCLWSWKVTTPQIQPGLVFVKCRRCGANTQVIVNRAGSLRMPCNTTVFESGPTHDMG